MDVVACALSGSASSSRSGAIVDLPSATPTAGAFASVVVLGLFCTALALVLMAILIGEAGPSRASVITYINPVIALALGIVFLSEEPGAGTLVGLALILVGSWFATRAAGSADRRDLEGTVDAFVGSGPRAGPDPDHQ